MSYLRACLAASITLLAIACDSKPIPPRNSPPPAARASAPTGATATTGGPATTMPTPTGATGGDAVTVQGVSFPIPQGWKQMPPSNPMRSAELHVPDPSGDPAKECVAAFSTAGGDVQGNIARWAGQVRDAAGNPATPQVRAQAVAGMSITTVTLRGSYSGMNEPVRQNWVMHGAIVETPSGLIFVKMTGPAEQMGQATPAFDAMIAALRK